MGCTAIDRKCPEKEEEEEEEEEEERKKERIICSHRAFLES